MAMAPGLAARGEGGEVAGRAPAADADLARSPTPGRHRKPRRAHGTGAVGQGRRRPGWMEEGGKFLWRRKGASGRCGGRP